MSAGERHGVGGREEAGGREERGEGGVDSVRGAK